MNSQATLTGATNHPSSVLLFGAYLAGGLVYLWLVFSPAVLVPFAHHDQYRYFQEDFHDPCHFKAERGNDTEYLFIWRSGRPLLAEVEYHVFRHVHSIADLSVVRALTLSLTALALALWALGLRRLGFGAMTSFCISAASYTLPSHQVTIYMGSIAHLLADLFAFTAFLILHWSGAQPVLPGRRPRSSLAAIRYFTALLFLLAAFYAYTPRALFFLVFLLAVILAQGLRNWPQVRGRVARSLVFLAMAEVVFFLTVRLVLCPPQALRTQSPTYSVTITSHLLPRLHLFASDVLVRLFDLWVIYRSTALALIVAGFIACGGLLSAVHWLRAAPDRRDLLRRGRTCLEVGGAILLILFAAEVCFLLQPTDLDLHRMHFASTAMIVLLLIAAAEAWSGLSPARVRRALILSATGFLPLAGGLLANANMMHNALNDNMEITFVSSQLAAHLKEPFRHVHVILPAERDRGYTGLLAIDDEFNRNTLSYFPDIPEVIRAALLQVAQRDSFMVHTSSEPSPAGGPEEGVIRVTHSRPGEPVPSAADTVVIDMNCLAALNHKPKPPLPPTAGRHH